MLLIRISPQVNSTREGRSVRSKRCRELPIVVNPPLRWRVNNFTINLLPYINFLISLVVQSLIAKPSIQVLYGKYYLCNKS